MWSLHIYNAHPPILCEQINDSDFYLLSACLYHVTRRGIVIEQNSILTNGSWMEESVGKMEWIIRILLCLRTCPVHSDHMILLFWRHYLHGVCFLSKWTAPTIKVPPSLNLFFIQMSGFRSRYWMEMSSLRQIYFPITMFLRELNRF